MRASSFGQVVLLCVVMGACARAASPDVEGRPRSTSVEPGAGVVGDGGSPPIVNRRFDASVGAQPDDAAGDGAGLDAAAPDARSAGPFAASNVDVAALDFDAAPSLVLDCGVTRIDTSSTPPTLTNFCGSAPRASTQAQSGGPDVVVIALRGLTIASGSTLQLVGELPVALVVDGDVSIAGSVDASAHDGVPGAGGDQACEASAGGAGDGEGSGDGTGGGGGGFGTRGGQGGSNHAFANGAAGATRGNANLVPLLGGCGGGRGGGGGGRGGAGGGAVQISASGALTITGSISVAGGDGAQGNPLDCGGGGGGSGGAILLEAASVQTSSGQLDARGGAGGAGNNGASGGRGASSEAANGANGGNGGITGAGGAGGGFGRIVTRLMP